MSALRAWYAGVGSREALGRYCPQAFEGGQSARGVIGRIRRQLASFALSRHRADLARLFQCAVGERTRYRKAAFANSVALPAAAMTAVAIMGPTPRIFSSRWLAVDALCACQMRSSYRTICVSRSASRSYMSRIIDRVSQVSSLS
ncbi:hypothetical protein SCB29_31870 [Paraburkholderia sp. SIMBA_055]